MHRFPRFLSLATALFAATAAQAAPVSLGLDPSLNLLAFGNMNVASSDVEGRVAVGGNATINGYSINTKTGSSALYSGTGLTVGGNLAFTNGTIWGGAVVGGSYTPNNSGNVIGGTLALPTDYQYAAGNLGVARFLWWRRLILPAIFPAFITGAITASGGCWNASIATRIPRMPTCFIVIGITSSHPAARKQAAGRSLRIETRL